MAKISKYKKKNGQVAWMYKGHIATDPRTGEKINTTRRGFSSKQEAQKDYDEYRHQILYGVKKKEPDMTFEDLWNGNSFFDKFYKVQNFFPYAIPIVLDNEPPR
ncbi:Arm DNA-binding domain-containing protein, partial [Enterococcus casseliflavus]